MTRPEKTTLATVLAVGLFASAARADEPTSPPTEAAPAEPAPKVDTASEAPARSAIEQAEEALAEGRLVEARDAFAALGASARARAGLARAESKLGAHVSAARHFAEAIALARRDEPALAAALQRELAAEKPHVVTIVLTTDAPAGTAFVVDGAQAGESPLRAPLYLEPGSHTIALIGADLTPPLTKVELPAGANVRLDIPSRGEPPKALWPALVLGGVGAVGLGAGIGLLVTSFQRESEADELAATIPSCDLAAPSTRCENLASLVSDRNALRDGSTVGFVVAGIAVAATVAYVLIPTPAESPSAAALSDLRVGAATSGDGLGVSLFGRFR